MKRFIQTALFLLLCGFSSFAQYEISIHAGGGLSTLQYNVNIGEQTNSPGIQIGFGFRYYTSYYWRIVSGIEFGMYNAKYNLSALQIKSDVKDEFHEEDFIFRSALTDYNEKQGAMMLQIPLMAHYQYRKNYQYFGAGGIKLGIPLSGYFNSAANIENEGYYPRDDYSYKIQEFRGFGLFRDKNSDGNLGFKIALIISLEGGLKWDLGKDISLYTCLYIDYGLNNIYKGSAGNEFVGYNHNDPRNFAVNSIMQSEYTQNDKSPQPFTTKITPMAVGIKFILSAERF